VVICKNKEKFEEKKTAKRANKKFGQDTKKYYLCWVMFEVQGQTNTKKNLRRCAEGKIRVHIPPG
jgi:hypothetical protein